MKDQDDSEAKSSLKSSVKIDENGEMTSFALKGLIVNSLGKVGSIIVKGSIGIHKSE